MKKFILIVVSLIACGKGEQTSSPDLHSRWMLIESLADPGDGSGKWIKADAKEYVKFNLDGSIESNSILKDRYFKVVDSVTINISLQANMINSIPWRYKITGSKLFLNPPCIEACGYRLIKL